MLTYLRRNLVLTQTNLDRQERIKELFEITMKKSLLLHIKDPIVGKYEWIYDLDLTSLYPSIIMTLNISPESKIGKIQDWDFNKFVKGDVDTYYIGDDSISKENLKTYLEQSSFQCIKWSSLQNRPVGCSRYS